MAETSDGMMRYTLSFLSFLSLVTLSCSPGESASDEKPVNGARTEQAEEKDQEAVKVKGEKGRRSYTPEELNEPYSRVSPWRYIVTSPETGYFERMVGSSSLARTVHGSGHAILVPEDITFTDNRDWKGILDPGQEQALDRFVGAHILKGIKGAKMLEGEFENHNGEMVAIERDAQGQLVCGGARLLGRTVETDFGLVIPVVGMVESIQWD